MSKELAEAIFDVEAGHFARIAKPGCWVVYRKDPGGHVLFRICSA